jgi:pimeloyl-ACP methyl ester carboxylesterase
LGARSARLAALCLSVIACGCATHGRPIVPDRRTAFNGHPLKLHFANAAAPASRPLLVFATGDGGMHRKDLDMYRHLDAWGYPLVGFDARDYVKHLGPTDTTTPERLAQDYRDMIAAAREALHLDPSRRIVLVGVSRGAGLSVVAAGELRDAVSGVIAIALTREEEYVRWYRRLLVLPRREVMVDVEEYLQQLGDLPLAVVQSTHDKYLPGAAARVLLGPDGPHRWLQVVDAHNHSFGGARAPLYAAIQRALEWIDNAGSRIPHPASRIPDPDDNLR